MRMALALVLSALLTGCGKSGSEPNSSMAPLRRDVPSTAATSGASASSSAIFPERRWVVEQFGGETAPRIHPPAAIVTFWSNGRLGGMNLCNGIGGAATWNVDGTFANLEQPLISTLVACGDKANQGKVFAERFWRKMQFAKQWHIEGPFLEIRFSDGTIARLREISSEKR